MTQPLVVDLAHGFADAAAELDRCAPAAVRITWNGVPVGELPGLAGAEPLAARHLAAWVEGPGALPLARMLALAAELGLSGVQPELCASAESLRGLPPPARASDESAACPPPAAAHPLELADGLAGLRRLAGTREPLALLVRRRGNPLGWVQLSRATSPRTIADVIYALLAQLDYRLLLPQPQAAPITASLPPVSVVICTGDRAEHLRACLAALARQQHAPAEIIVVDTGSRDDATLRVAAAAGVQYVREEQPSLSQARNRGLRAAASPIVACLDDDACPAADWLLLLARGFAEAQATGQRPLEPGEQMIIAQPSHAAPISEAAA